MKTIDSRAWDGPVQRNKTALFPIVLGLFVSSLMPAPGLGSSLGPDSFSAEGLHHSGSLQGLFRGEYEKVDFNREDLAFAAIFRQYLRQYALHCHQHLPANRVEMTEQKCARESVTRNGFGVEINRVCIEYVDVGTGVFAKPELYAAMVEIDRLMGADSVRQSWRLIMSISSSNSLDGLTSLTVLARKAQLDMEALVRRNDCSGPGLLRFEENLRRFATNEPAIRLDGGPGLEALMSEAWPAFTSDDWRRMLEDLVYEQSRTWAMNQYIQGSVHEVKYYPRGNELGRIEVWYRYHGFSGRSLGVATLIFEDGKLTCLEFGDARGVCRTPSRRIVVQHVKRVLTSPLVGPADESGSNPGPDHPVTDRPQVGTETNAPTAATASDPIRTTQRSARKRAVGRAGRRTAPPTEPPKADETHTQAAPETDAEGDEKPDVSTRATPPAPRRVLTAVNYVQGIKLACLEVLTGGERREPETSYCFCLSASVGAMSVPEKDVRWFFENFSLTAIQEMESRHPSLVRPFASCLAQRDASSAD